jgi:hypothetical protein
VVALVAAFVAWRQVREARRLREEQAQPFVVVDIEPNPNDLQVLELVVANIGNTLARDVKISFDPPLSRAFRSENDPNEWAIFKDGIPSFPPHKSYRFWLDIGHERKTAGIHDVKYNVTVAMNGPRGQRLDSLSYVVDLSPYYGPNFMGVKTLHHAAKALEALAKDFHEWRDRGTRGDRI